MTFGLSFMISSVAPTRLSTSYAYLITKIGSHNLKNDKLLSGECPSRLINHLTALEWFLRSPNLGFFLSAMRQK